MDESLHETKTIPCRRSSTRSQTGHNVCLNTRWAQDPDCLAEQSYAQKNPQTDPQTPARTISTSTSDASLDLSDAYGDGTPSAYSSDADLVEFPVKVPDARDRDHYRHDQSMVGDVCDAHSTLNNDPGCGTDAIAENSKIDGCESRGSIQHPFGCRPCHFHRRGGCTEGSACRYCHACGMDAKRVYKKAVLRLKKTARELPATNGSQQFGYTLAVAIPVLPIFNFTVVG